MIDEISEHEEETIKRVENFQDLTNGSAAPDQNDMNFGGITVGKKDSVSLHASNHIYRDNPYLIFTEKMKIKAMTLIEEEVLQRCSRIVKRCLWLEGLRMRATIIQAA